MHGTPPEPAADHEASLRDLLHLLALEEREPDVYQGLSPKERWQRVFGGQVLGQALSAASQTVDNRACHSLHAYFLRPGDPKTPIAYHVDRSRDGGSFSVRRVAAQQSGNTIFVMAASFQDAEEGLDHQAAMPEVPPPEALKSEQQLHIDLAADMPESARTWFLRPRPIEFRPVQPANRFLKEPQPPRQIVWMRAAAPIPQGTAFHQCVLAYASDMTLLDTSLLPHGYSIFSEGLQLASLDHAMWFHRPFDAAEWLLYVEDSPSASGGRGFNRGQIFRRDGTLVASVAQEGLMRVRGGIRRRS